MGDMITSMERDMQRRTELLLGVDTLSRIQQAQIGQMPIL